MTQIQMHRHDAVAVPSPAPAPQMWSAATAGAETKPRDVLGMLRRNAVLIIACVALAMIAAAAVLSRQVPKYEASTSLRIDEKQSGLPALEVLQSSTSPSELLTEREILASRSIAEDVVDSLGLQVQLVAPAGATRDRVLTDVRATHDLPPVRYRLVRTDAQRFSVQDSAGRVVTQADTGQIVRLPGVEFRLGPAAVQFPIIDLAMIPFDDAVDVLRSTIEVGRANREVNIVEVRYRGEDPTLVRAVPNMVAKRFIERRQDARQMASRSTVAFLREQLDRLTQQLQSSEGALRRFRERENVVDLAEQGRTHITHVAELQAQRSALETERSALARLVSQARSGTGANGTTSRFRDVLAFPTLLRNQAASQLLGSLTVVEDRRSELLNRRSPRDPDVEALNARAEQLEGQLRGIAETYLQGLTDQVVSVDAELGRSAQRLAPIPAQAAELARLERDAKGLGEMYGLLRTRLKEAEIAAAVQDGSVRIVDRAVLPRRPVEPKPAVTLTLALVVGLVVGVSAAFAREYADNAVHSRDEVQGITHTAVLGLVPRIRPGMALSTRLGNTVRRLLPGPSRRDVPGANGSDWAFATDDAMNWSVAREVFNGLHAKVAFAAGREARRTLIVTSPLPGDGKTTIAVNFAGTVARQGQKVLLIDGDLRRGIVHSLFQLPRSPGFADVLVGAIDIGAAIRVVPVADGRVLHVLSRGTPNDDPARTLDPARVQAFTDMMAAEFDWVIIDSPPLNVVADASLLGATGAGVILVARAGVTPTAALAYAAEQLQSIQATLIGTILNAIDKREASYDSGYQYYAHATGYHADTYATAPVTREVTPASDSF